MNRCSIAEQSLFLRQLYSLLQSVGAFLIMLAAAEDACADTTRWNKNSSGFFGDTANWDDGVPDGFDTAVFRRGTGIAYTATLLGGNPATSPPVHYGVDKLAVGSNTV